MVPFYRYFSIELKSKTQSVGSDTNFSYKVGSVELFSYLFFSAQLSVTNDLDSTYLVNVENIFIFFHPLELQQ